MCIIVRTSIYHSEFIYFLLYAIAFYNALSILYVSYVYHFYQLYTVLLYQCIILAILFLYRYVCELFLFLDLLSSTICIHMTFLSFELSPIFLKLNKVLFKEQLRVWALVYCLFEPWLYHLPSVWTWANYLISLRHNLLI